jgi:hypothetical protein
MQPPGLGAFREVPFMEASKPGFVNGHPDWCNLGQGRAGLDFVEEAIRAHALGRSHPSLLPLKSS